MIDTGGIGGRGDESDGSADDNITVTVPPAHAHQPHWPHGSHASHGLHGHHGPPGAGGAHAQPPHTRPPNMHSRYGTSPNTVQFLCMSQLCMYPLFCILSFKYHWSIPHAVLGCCIVN